MEIVLTCGKTTGRVAEHLAKLGIATQRVEGWEGIERWGLSRRAVVQHFTGPGFLQAIMDKSLFVHATELRDGYELVIFLLSGEMPRDRGLHPNALRGAISALPIQYGVTLLWAEDEVEAARLIRQMAEHEQMGVPDVSLHPKRKAQDLPDLQRRVAEMLPGCGMVNARRLLRHFGSLRAIACASEEELIQVAGIGRHTAAQIRSVLEWEYLDLDWEQDIEDVLISCPGLLFAHKVEVVARQHLFLGPDGERLIPDLVVADAAHRVLYVVELKRSAPTPADMAQLCCYLVNARASELLSAYLGRGWRLHGVLASPEPARCSWEEPDITIVVLPREALLAELARLRAMGGRQAGQAGGPAD